MRALSILSTLLLFSCYPYDEEADRRRLLELHHQAREDLFLKNAERMVEGFADDILMVNRGKIDSLSTREDHIQRIQRYFDAVKFVTWDDVAPPSIRFSDDHSLAYMTVDKLVVLETTDSIGKPIESTTHFAWIAIFRKQKNGDWKIECVASTNQPEIIKPISTHE